MYIDTEAPAGLPPIGPEQWDMIEALLKVLKPPYIFTVTLSGAKYPTLALAYPLSRSIMHDWSTPYISLIPLMCCRSLH
jgi:hypothetical protein